MQHQNDGSCNKTITVSDIIVINIIIITISHFQKRVKILLLLQILFFIVAQYYFYCLNDKDTCDRISSVV